MDNLELIKKSFERWYNAQTPYSEKVSVLISYRDEQNLVMKAYHRVTADLSLIYIKNRMSYTSCLCSVTDTYNHGVTSEQDAKDALMSKLLEELLHYVYTQSI